MSMTKVTPISTKVHKVIITNRAALERKYGSTLSKIDRAISDLIAADEKRGLTTMLLDVADAATMRKYRGKPVTTASNPKQNKSAIDKIYQSLIPDYLMILGAPDVIPQQNLINPLFDPDNPLGDPDRFAPSDLPYACDRPYSQKIEDFTGPTRVVGRLPDISGGSEADYLAGLLATCASYKTRPRSAYNEYLSISAKVWQGSTELSSQAIFGSSDATQLSPPKGPRWPAKLLESPSHFINCHGSPADPHFYGQQGSNFPIAHDAGYLSGRLTEGTVCSAECCYGAELYDPVATAVSQPGMCNTYLGSAAYAFFGSSTVAYGPADKNAQADVIAQDFLRHVLSGASTGRSCLQARQDFVMKAGVLDPFDLKTLAQFSLMGDPSIHAVQRVPSDDAVILTKSLHGLASDALEHLTGLARRRDTLRKNGLALAQAANFVVTTSRKLASPSIRDALRSLMTDSSQVRVVTFLVSGMVLRGKQMKFVRDSGRGALTAHVHVAVSRTKVRNAPTPQYEAVVAREIDGALSVRKLTSR
jgi:hypothetical protein